MRIPRLRHLLPAATTLAFLAGPAFAQDLSPIQTMLETVEAALTGPIGIAVATLASISERRIENMVNPDLSGLPAFLAPDPGLNSGFMIPQVVAASLVSENKSLAHPASVDSIPTSANREDHVSMGVTAARHARDITNNVASVLGIEVICAAQGLEFDRSLGAGRGAEAAYKTVRSRVPKLEQDRYLAPDLAAGRELVSSRAILDAVEAEVGALE